MAMIGIRKDIPFLKPLRGNAAGFTLVELMIAMVITGIIVAAMYMAYQAQQRTYVVQEQVTEMQQNLRAAMMIMAADIRMAGYDRKRTGKYGITTATPAKLVFSADFDDSGGLPAAGDTMTYELYTPSGATMTSLRRISGQGAVADNIQAVEFQYLDKDGNDLGSATGGTVSGASNLAKIRSIKVSLLARASKPDRKYTDTKYYCPASNPFDPATGQCTNPAPATIWGPHNDNYRRRLLISEINCRNLGL